MATWITKPANDKHGAYYSTDVSADALGDALDKIIDDFEFYFKRLPSKREILKAMNNAIDVHERGSWIQQFPRKEK